MQASDSKCVFCDRDKNQVPLLAIYFKDEVTHICPQHLPNLIHKPQTLIGKMPGAENLESGVPAHQD